VAIPSEGAVGTDMEMTHNVSIRELTEQQMSEQPITGYKPSQLRVVPVGADAALVTP